MGQHLSCVENYILEDFVEPKAYLVLTLIIPLSCATATVAFGLGPYSPFRELSMAITPGDMSTVHLPLHFAGNHGML